MKYLKIIFTVISFLAIGLLALLLNKRGQKIIPDFPPLKTELKAIQVEAEIKRKEALTSKEEAQKHVEVEYAEHLAKLDSDQKLEAEQLKKDPAKLAAWLIRQGAS